MKVAVIGASGQLGTDVQKACEAAGVESHSLTHAEIDVGDSGSVHSCLAGQHYDVVINTAAFHNVDLCERRPEEAFRVNALGARNLAESARKEPFVLMHISTDYVFDGAKDIPYTESEAPRPLNTYGNSKLSGEYFVRAIAPRAWIVRTSGLYGAAPCRAKGGLNFVQAMLKLGHERDEVRVVTDEIVSPTPTTALGKQLLALAGHPAQEGVTIVHATSRGACSWFDFAVEIFRCAGLAVRVTPARSQDFPRKVPRPSYSVLEHCALEALGLDVMPTWQEGLHAYLRDLGLMNIAAVPA